MARVSKENDSPLDCGRRGDLDDVNEYDRPSVRFQQVLNLAWHATREDRPLTIKQLAAEAGTDDHTPVVYDMLSSGCLIDVRGALVPSDRLIDEGDAGRIHTVIAGGVSSAVIDIKTGDAAFRDADEASTGGALYHAGAMRRLMSAGDGTAYLSEVARGAHPLARIKATGPALPMSRSIVWALARLNGYDPARWQLSGSSLLTWGGQTLNTLLAAVFSRSAPERRFAPTPTAVSGDIFAIDLSLEAIKELGKRMKQQTIFRWRSL